jgi:hypothetical protein
LLSKLRLYFNQLFEETIKQSNIQGSKKVHERKKILLDLTIETYQKPDLRKQKKGTVLCFYKNNFL